MNKFFDAVNNCNPNHESMTVTVISGAAAGEKAVISDGKIQYMTSGDGFLKSHEAELKSLSGSGIETLDGAEIYTERVGHRKKLVVCGCGHVSIPIIKIGKMLGFHVTAIDDRAEFVDNAEEAGADEGMCDAFSEALKRIEGDPFTYFVIVTRGHHWDEECLRTICLKPHAYIGMMGSKRRVAVVKENLKAEGIDGKVIDNVHSPIGLNIGSETPEEIAVSVLAEIIEVKSGNKDFTVPDDILRAINGTEHSEAEQGSKIMATIVGRKGSAPREVGTKMLILENGSCVNTIGGGCVEARVIERGKEMLEENEAGPEILHIELTAEAASLEGEVCGGVLDVLMETIDNK